MAKRMAFMLLIFVAFLVTLGLVKYRQVSVAMAQSASFQPPPEAVTTVTARHDLWPRSRHAIGTAAAVNGVVVSADLPGIVKAIEFDSGRPARAGDLLVQLDTSQEQAQLASAEAALELSRLQRERTRGLQREGVVAQAEADRVEAESTQAQARVREIRATIERKTIRAPFTGVLGLRQVNLGQYLEGGAPIVPLQAMAPIHVNFALPQQEAAGLRLGAEVHATLSGQEAEATGKLTALDALVDEGTRNVMVQATFANADHRLRPGMFVDLQVIIGEATEVVALPASAISYAPYGDSVFIVDEITAPDGRTYKGARQQFVKLGAARGDQVTVLSGVEPGMEVVSSGAFKLRDGAAVVVNNEIQPGNDPAPTPENN